MRCQALAIWKLLIENQQRSVILSMGRKLKFRVVVKSHHISYNKLGYNFWIFVLILKV